MSGTSKNSGLKVMHWEFMLEEKKRRRRRI